MTEPLSIEDRLAIESLITEYAWLLDQRRFDDLPGLFTDDAVLHIRRRQIEGHQGLADWAEYRAQKGSRRTQHQMTLIRLQAVDSDHVSGTAALVLHVAKSGAGTGTYVDLVGEYEDSFRRTADGWRFSARRLRRIDES